MRLGRVMSGGASRRWREGNSCARNVFHFSVSYDDGSTRGAARGASRSRFGKLLFVPHRSPLLGESTAFSFTALYSPRAAAKFLHLGRRASFAS